jgi:polyisoprenoid-binding protein YceI
MSVMSGGGSAPAPGFPDGLQSISLTVKVADIECPEEQMKEHLREAMEASAHPEIVYELQQYTITGSTAEASGTISIHGVTKPITLEIQLVESPEGVRGIGETEIDMTEFGVTPPSLWGGLMNVGELVTIKFDALLSN